MRAGNCMRDYGTTNNTPAHQAPPVWRAPEGLEDLTAAQVGDGGACQHTNDKPDRSGAPRGLRGLAGHHTDTPTDWRPPRGLAGHHTDTPTDWRPPRGLRGLAAVLVGGGGACQHTNDKPDRSGAPRGLRGLAGHHTDTPTDWRPPRGLAGHHTDTPTDWRPPRGLRGPAAVPVGGGRAWPGFEIDHSERSSRVAISRAGRRPPAPTRRHKHSATNA